MKALLALVLICFSLNSNSQTWPSRPLRYIVPFPPGAFNDTLARTSTPEQFGEFVRAEVGRWAKVIKEAGIRAD